MAMWKSAIAMTHIDHQLSNSETNLIYDYISNYNFSDAQIQELEHDLRSGVDFESVYPLITEKRDRAHLINFALILFHIDGNFSEAEEALWEAINNRHNLSIDLKQAFKDAREAGRSFEEEEKMKRQHERESSWLDKAFSFLLDFD